MLGATEFSVGYVGSVDALTLVLPVDKYDRAFLVVPATEGPVAVFLNGEHQFQAIKSSGNQHYKGLLIPSVRVEVDVTSVGPASYPSAGAMVRSGRGLFVAATLDRTRGSSLFEVDPNLIDCGPKLEADFTKWQVVLGIGVDRRPLWTVDLKTETSSSVTGSPT